jgi:hypothetical protein
MNHLPPTPLKIINGSFQIFQKFTEIFASQGAPMGPGRKFCHLYCCDTGGKFFNGAVDTGFKYWEQYQIAFTLSELEGKNLSIC